MIKFAKISRNRTFKRRVIPPSLKKNKGRKPLGDLARRWRRIGLFATIVVAHLLVLRFFPTEDAVTQHVKEETTDVFFIAPRIVPQTAAPPIRHEMRKIALPPAPSTAITIAPRVVAPRPAPTEAASVDWMEEAHRIAQSSADNLSAASKPHESKSSGPTSIWSAPAHHAGEQYQAGNGDWVVWTSSHCYQVSKSIIGAGGAANHWLPETVCPGDGAARGELFKDLQEYKKRHPDASP